MNDPRLRIAAAAAVICLLVACERTADAPPPPADTAPAPAPDAKMPRRSAPADVELYLIAPTDGDRVRGAVHVVFGLKGMGVAPLGVAQANTGHHHLLIDTDLPPGDMPILADEKHLHFGGGQTEAMVELSPGEHRLQLLLGDENHVPHDPPVSSEIVTVTVIE